MKFKKLTSLKRLQIELRRLKRVHDVTMYSYQQTRDYIAKRLRDKEIFGNTILSMKLEDGERYLARSPYEIIPRLSDTYPEILRESLLVRAVSQFEVFLVDTVREIAQRSIEPFKQQDKMLEYPQAQILSYGSIEEIQTEILNGECRQLTSSGFNYARKYYEKRFGIRFSDCSVPITEIEELHERRHLLVHRSGHIDSQFQKRFAPSMQVDERITITDQYFQKSLDNLAMLCVFIADRVDDTWPVTTAKKELAEFFDKYIAQHQNSVTPGDTLAYWFKAKFKDKTDLDNLVNPSFHFLVNEEGWSKFKLITLVRSRLAEKA